MHPLPWEVIAQILIPTILGALLSWVGPSVIDYIKSKKDAETFKISVFSELHELRYQFINAIYLIESSRITHTRESLLWIKENLSRYSDTTHNTSFIQPIEMMLQLTDEQFASTLDIIKPAPGKMSSIKKYNMPVLDSRIGQISSIDKELVSLFLEIKLRITSLNQNVDPCFEYLKMTYNESISASNIENLKSNIDAGIRVHHKFLKQMVERINYIERKFGPFVTSPLIDDAEFTVK